MKILVITEQREAKWNPVSSETLVAAQQIAAAQPGSGVAAAVIGKGVRGLAEQAAANQLAEVLLELRGVALRLLDGGHGLADDAAVAVADVGDDGVGALLEVAGDVAHAAAVDADDGDVEGVVGVGLLGGLLGRGERSAEGGEPGGADGGVAEEFTPTEEAHGRTLW